MHRISDPLKLVIICKLYKAIHSNSLTICHKLNKHLFSFMLILWTDFFILCIIWAAQNIPEIYTNLLFIVLIVFTWECMCVCVCVLEWRSFIWKYAYDFVCFGTVLLPYFLLRFWHCIQWVLSILEKQYGY